MTITGFIAYSAALGIAAAIPGPGVTALVARALGSGFRSSLAMSFGLMLGDLTYLTAVVLGLAFVAQTFGMVFLVDQMAGRRLSRLPRLDVSGPAASRPRTSRPRRARADLLASFLAGLTVTLGNPKTMIFYLAITPTIVDLKTITLADYGILVALTVSCCSWCWCPIWRSPPRRAGSSKTPRALKALNRTAAGFMVGAAAAIAARQ